MLSFFYPSQSNVWSHLIFFKLRVKSLKGHMRGGRLCVCQYLWAPPPPALSSSASAILFRAFSLPIALLSVCSAYLDATTSVISAAPNPPPNTPHTYWITDWCCELLFFFLKISQPVSVLSGALRRHFETSQSISWDLWCLIPFLYLGGLWGNAARPTGTFFEVR